MSLRAKLIEFDLPRSGRDTPSSLRGFVLLFTFPPPQCIAIVCLPPGNAQVEEDRPVPQAGGIARTQRYPEPTRVACKTLPISEPLIALVLSWCSGSAPAPGARPYRFLFRGSCEQIRIPSAPVPRAAEIRRRTCCTAKYRTGGSALSVPTRLEGYRVRRAGHSGDLRQHSA